MASDINIASPCFSNALFKRAIFCAVFDTYVFWNVEDGISIHAAKLYQTVAVEFTIHMI